MKDLHDDETRITDAATGGQKGKKITQLGALDPVALIELSRVAGMGANKYAAFNFLKGYDWSLSFNAMMRHALLFWSGENTDPESQLNHMAHAAWMALSLVSFAERGLGTDDRFKQPSEAPPSQPDPLRVAFEATARPDMYDVARFFCGHKYGEEPTVGQYPGEANCGTRVHWSRTAGVYAPPKSIEG